MDNVCFSGIEASFDFLGHMIFYERFQHIAENAYKYEEPNGMAEKIR